MILETKALGQEKIGRTIEVEVSKLATLLSSKVATIKSWKVGMMKHLKVL